MKGTARCIRDSPSGLKMCHISSKDATVASFRAFFCWYSYKARAPFLKDSLYCSHFSILLADNEHPWNSSSAAEHRTGLRAGDGFSPYLGYERPYFELSQLGV